MFENGGLIVHFFDDALVQQLSECFELLDVDPFTEGDLPRNLWRVDDAEDWRFVTARAG